MIQRSKSYAISMIGICMTFLFYKYLLQLFPSVMTENLMQHYHLSGAQLGNLAACFFYGYSIMQLLSGPLVDRYGIRALASLALFIAALGVGIFVYTSNLLLAATGRCMMGIGGAFATICYLRCTASWCTAKTLAFAGGCLTIGVMLGACLGEEPLALAIKYEGLQASLIAIALIGLGLAILSFLFLREGQIIKEYDHYWLDDLKKLLSNKKNWLLAAYSGFAFAPLAVFAGLWGTPFIQLSQQWDKASSAGLVSLCWIGFGIGGPLFGYLSDRDGSRCKWMLIGLGVSFISLIIILYMPLHSKSMIALCMLFFGMGTGSFMLGFTCGKEINQPWMAATVFAFINSGDALLGAITEPLVGHLLDINSHSTNSVQHTFSIHAYHIAFSLLIGYLFIAIGFASLCNKIQNNKTVIQIHYRR